MKITKPRYIRENSLEGQFLETMKFTRTQLDTKALIEWLTAHEHCQLEFVPIDDDMRIRLIATDKDGRLTSRLSLYYMLLDIP